MVMEFVRGETLENMVARMGPLSAQRAAEFCMQALAALAHAHSMGVVHRDLKPANFMVTENGAIKVMDFGIARVSGSEHLTNAGFMMGTPAYMAPEQVRGGDIDARTDLYSMGVVFYRLCTAQLPFRGDTPFAIVQSQVNDPPTPIATARPDLPPWVQEVISRSLAKAPEERFQSAAEFHEALARCLAGLPLSSMYVTGPMEIGMTPPRPMPTGAFARPMPTPPMPTPYPHPTSSMTAPHMTASNMTVLAPGTNPGAISSASDPTMLTPALGQATSRMAGGLTSSGAPSTPAAETTQSTPQPAGTASTPGAKSRNTTLFVAAGLVLVLGGVAFVLLKGGGSASAGNESATPAGQTAQVTPAPSTPVPDATQTTPPPAGTTTVSGGTAASGGTAPAGAAATSSNPNADGTKPQPTPNRAGGAPGAPNQPTPTPTPAGRAAGAADAAADNVLATFGNVKFYAPNGKRTTDRDVSIHFLNGLVMVIPKTGGQPIASVPYRRILRATYNLGRDPKWDTALPGPPEGLDVGSFMRQTRHWLVVQGAESFAVLRLEDANFKEILDTFEKRTGIRVERRSK
jgi:serine/threonine-protein kinase